MPELETKITAWRKRLSAEFPGQTETVRELDAHLRDHIEAQCRRGMTVDDAFAQGVAQIGQPRAIAREFKRVERPWFAVRPLVVIYGLVGMLLTVIFALAMWEGYFFRVGLPGGGYFRVYILTTLSGYLALIAAGLVGAWTIASGWGRRPPERELHAQRREMFRLAVASSVLMTLGTAAGRTYALNVFPYRAWSWAPAELGEFSVLLASWLLLLVQLRVIVDSRVREGLALLGAAIVGVALFSGMASTATVPIGWLWIATVLSQGAVALLRHPSECPSAEEKPNIATE